MPMLPCSMKGRHDGEMFTGLVEGTGKLAARNHTLEGGMQLWVEGMWEGSEIVLGDSIAVNGCCLTVAEQDGARMRFDLLQETLAKTNLGKLPIGDTLNLERAMGAGSRFGGHLVQGHIDTTSEVLRIEERGADWRVDVAIPSGAASYFIPKGSITVNGISLTIAELGAEQFTLWIIPHTREVTNLRFWKKGTLVNLEYDMLAKYVERMLELRFSQGR